jgi:hypothetical protein
MKVTYLEHLEPEEKKKLFDRMRTDPPVVLIGSGVSRYWPTCLPMGKDFSIALCQLLFPDDSLKSLGVDVKTLKEFLDRIPFEVTLSYFPIENVEKLDLIIKNAFSTVRFNRIHEVLAKGLFLHRFEALITTNYDLCLDAALSHYGITPTVNQSDFERFDATRAKGYIKIHGSVNDPQEPPRYRLRQESRLKKWQRKTLHEIVRSRQLLTIGYSGTDFEICPELRMMPIKQVLWNRRTDKPLSSDAEQLLQADQSLQREEGHILIGDMRDLLSDYTSDYIEKSDKDDKEKCGDQLSPIIQQFTTDEIAVWGGSLLVNLGFPLLAQEFSKKVSATSLGINPIPADRIEVGSLFHTGKYKKSALLSQELAIRAKNKGDDISQAELLIYACNAWRCYGAPFRLWRCQKAVHTLVGSLSESTEEKKVEKMRLTAWVDLMVDTHTLTYIYRLARIIKLGWLIRRIAFPKFRRAAEYAADTGDWSTHHNISLWAQDMGIDPAKLTAHMEFAPPPPTKEGYRRMGYFVGEVIDFRGQLAKMKRPPNEKENQDLEDYLGKCSRLGHHPEVWKLLQIKMRRQGIIKSLKSYDFRQQFWREFRHCEYSLPMSLLYTLRIRLLGFIIRA